jgi:hypothetical protein
MEVTGQLSYCNFHLGGEKPHKIEHWVTPQNWSGHCKERSLCHSQELNPTSLADQSKPHFYTLYSLGYTGCQQNGVQSVVCMFQFIEQAGSNAFI